MVLYGLPFPATHRIPAMGSLSFMGVDCWLPVSRAQIDFASSNNASYFMLNQVSFAQFKRETQSIFRHCQYFYSRSQRLITET